MIDSIQKEGIEHVLAKVFEESREGILITNADGTILAVNKGYEGLTGYSKGEIVGNNPRMMKSGIHDAAFYQKMWHALREEGRWQGEVWDRHKTGEPFCKTLSISSARVGERNEVYYLGIFSDVTAKKQTEFRLEQMAHYDQLTGLPNRILFLERLKIALQSSDHNGKQVAVMFVDLDHFKRINDTLGHLAGDQLLKEVAKRCSRTVRESDTVARMGGDEFTVVVPEITQVTDAILVARKIIECFVDPFIIQGREIFTSASIGISMYPFDGGANELVKNADVAMYESKRKGKNRYQFYSPLLNNEALQRLDLESELHRAIERNELILHYQPQLDLATNRILSVEALLRWQHPQKGLLPPGEFMEIAERAEFVGKIGEWALTEACRAAARWNRSIDNPVKVWVNVAGPQFALDNIVSVVKRALSASSLSASCLGLELTERFVMTDVNAVTLILEKLSRLGVELSIDDFGTGYSSLYYLNRFPLNHLKIPKEFIDDIPAKSDGAVIATAIIAMARSLKLQVVAEGVETQSQLDVLRENKCDIIQGYLISHPLSETDLIEFLAGAEND